MKKVSFYLLLLGAMITTYACTKKTTCGFGDNKGRIEQQGITTYQYGSHILVDEQGETIYALSSDKIDLNNYVHQVVEVNGSFMPGYPIESGPNYLYVTKIKN